jgi:hypothetical protein
MGTADVRASSAPEQDIIKRADDSAFSTHETPAAGGAHFEASCRGALGYMISQGYPAEKIVVGFGFYANGGAPYSSIPVALKTATPDPNYMEVSDAGAWWPNAAGIQLKMDAVLSPAQSVLPSNATAAGVGFWQWGNEDPSSPDLSQAMKTKIAAY